MIIRGSQQQCTQLTKQTQQMPLSNHHSDEVLDFQRKILERLHRGDLEALGCLYDMHIEYLMAFGLKYVNDVAWVEDQIHDLFLEFFKARNKVLHIQNVRAYLSTCLKRKLYKRNKSKELLVPEEKFPFLTQFISQNVESSAEAKWIDSEQVEYLKRGLQTAMDSLTIHQQSALHLRFVENKSYGEIAEHLDVSKASARTLLYRSIKMLREKLQFLLF